MKKVLIIAVLVVACILVYLFFFNKQVSKGDGSDNKELVIGMNLSSVSYWNRELPFVDIFKSCSPWVTQNAVNVEGGKNAWHTNVLASIPLDKDGYPLSLPVPVSGTEAPQTVATIMCLAMEGRYPAGKYVCLYDGTGDINFALDAKIVKKDPGRIELEVKPTNSGIFMKIVRSDSNDHVRNIRVMMPGFETSPADKPFNPLFIERLKGFRVIRFMDWQRTNDSIVERWAERTTPATYTQADKGGVAVEYMVQLCNTINADPWFCIPHKADADYVARFAALVRDTLAPERKVYIEYSNEVWNGMFGQYQWVQDNGKKSLSHPKKYADLAVQAFTVWTNQFGEKKGRIVRVMSGQQVRPSLLGDIISYAGPESMDAIATTAYFGISQEGYRQLKTLGERAAAGDVISSVYDDIRDHLTTSIPKHAALAAKYDIPYIAYEGGPSICPVPLGVSPTYQKALWDAQSVPEIYLAYREFLTGVRSLDMKLFMAFNFAGPQKSKSGSWGHLEYLDQPIEEAPKFRALIDEMNPRAAGGKK